MNYFHYQNPSDNTEMPPRVYRYVEDESEARAFIEGEIWLSTFEYIRNCDKSRADKDEGLRSYKVNFLDTSKKDGATELIKDRLKNSGINIAKQGVVFANNKIITRHPNSYLLCASMRKSNKRMRERFGKFCIQIEQPKELLRLVAESLQQFTPLSHAVIGKVDYKGRDFSDADIDISEAAFANVSGNIYEKEVRMIWRPRDPATTIERMKIKVPEAGKLCKIV